MGYKQAQHAHYILSMTISYASKDFRYDTCCINVDSMIGHVQHSEVNYNTFQIKDAPMFCQMLPFRPAKPKQATYIRTIIL